MDKPNMTGGLRDAFDNYSKGAEPEAEGNKEQDGGDQRDMVAMHSHKHKSGKHSTHKIMEDGTAESEMHEAGQGTDCPMC